MKYLDAILTDVTNKAERDKIYAMACIVDQNLEKQKIAFFDDNAEMIFTNHIVALGKRILEKKLIEIDSSLMKDVSDTALTISRSLIKDIFKTNDCAMNDSETFLVATHIQIYLDIKEGGKIYE